MVFRELQRRELVLIQTSSEEHGIVCNKSAATSFLLVGERKLDGMVYLTIKDTRGSLCGLPHLGHYVAYLTLYSWYG